MGDTHLMEPLAFTFDLSGCTLLVIFLYSLSCGDGLHLEPGDIVLARVTGDRKQSIGLGVQGDEHERDVVVGEDGGAQERPLLASSSDDDHGSAAELNSVQERERVSTVSVSDSGNKVSRDSSDFKVLTLHDSMSRYLDHVSVMTSRSTSTVPAS